MALFVYLHLGVSRLSVHIVRFFTGRRGVVPYELLFECTLSRFVGAHRSFFTDDQWSSLRVAVQLYVIPSASRGILFNHARLGVALFYLFAISSIFEIVSRGLLVVTSLAPFFMQYSSTSFWVIDAPIQGSIPRAVRYSKFSLFLIWKTHAQ